MDRLEYESGMMRGHANRYQRQPAKKYLTKPDELRAEAKHLRLVAADLDNAAKEIEDRDAALTAEYGPPVKTVR